MWQLFKICSPLPFGPHLLPPRSMPLFRMFLTSVRKSILSSKPTGTLLTRQCLAQQAKSPKSSCRQKPVPPWEALGEILFTASCSLWRLQEYPGLWLYHSNLSLLFCLSQTPLCLSLRMTDVSELRAHLCNPGWFHLKTVNYICKTPFSK